MKLMRVGAKGSEKPAILAEDGSIRDLSGVVADIGGQTLVARHGGLAPGGLHAGGEVTLAFAPEHLHLIGGQP